MAGLVREFEWMEKRKMDHSTTCLIMLAATASQGLAAITIAEGTSAPTYATTLNFDEPGTPTGIVPADTWSSIGLSELQAGDSFPVVGDHDQGWGVNDGNSFFGNFGVFMTFSSDLTEFSAQVWDPSGPPTFLGGGMGVFVLNDGVEVATHFFEPAWGGIGNDWLNITTDAGSTFDEVRILGFGFFPTTYMDNASWNVPAPGAAGMLAAVGLLSAGRRRR
ncbi:MAG: hypothetical protein RIB58_04520 [Phycisphaerales bacterium]